MSKEANTCRVTQPREYYGKFLEADIRPDGRELNQFRDVVLNVGSISTSDGSALVTLGNTSVICGIKAELAPPKPDEPNHGYIVPNVDLPALSSPHFKSGPPSELAQCASHFMLQVIESSRCIHLEDLCIVEGKMVWTLFCDMICLNFDGNLLDACTVAMTAALCNVKLPHASVNTETGTIEINMNKKIPLNMRNRPVATTLATIDKEVIFVDPTFEEEKLISTFVTVVTLDDGKLCIVYKPGGSSLSEEHLFKCISTAQTHTTEVISLIENSLEASSSSDT